MKSVLRVLFVLALAPAAACGADQLDPRGLEFFEYKIRPVLIEHCYKCHSAEAAKEKKLRGGLQLDTREGLLRGGDWTNSVSNARSIPKRTEPCQRT
jgi:hypothetical protein